MLPASELSEILTNLAALNLQPNTVAQVLTAVLTPLLRSSGSPELEDLRKDPKPTPKRPYRRAGRARASGIRPRKYKRHAPTEARDRALAALKANPEATPTEIAKLAKVSRSTAVTAAKQFAREARKEARRKSRTEAPRGKTDPKTERRSRAQRFLREILAQGPKEVQAVEAAAAKAHVDLVTLEQARGDLGVIATRANTGGVHAVQWALPG